MTWICGQLFAPRLCGLFSTVRVLNCLPDLGMYNNNNNNNNNSSSSIDIHNNKHNNNNNSSSSSSSSSSSNIYFMRTSPEINCHYNKRPAQSSSRVGSPNPTSRWIPKSHLALDPQIASPLNKTLPNPLPETCS